MRNAYRMAIPSKSRRFCSDKIDEKYENVAESGREKNGEAAIIGNCRILKDKTIGDKLSSQNLVKK